MCARGWPAGRAHPGGCSLRCGKSLAIAVRCFQSARRSDGCHRVRSQPFALPILTETQCCTAHPRQTAYKLTLCAPNESSLTNCQHLKKPAVTDAKKIRSGGRALQAAPVQGLGPQTPERVQGLEAPKPQRDCLLRATTVAPSANSANASVGGSGTSPSRTATAKNRVVTGSDPV